MKKYEYLSELEKRLSALPADARRDALNYYEEYFDAAGPDNEDATAAELGDPAEAARKILEGEGLTPDADPAAPESARGGAVPPAAPEPPAADPQPARPQKHGPGAKTMWLIFAVVIAAALLVQLGVLVLSFAKPGGGTASMVVVPTPMEEETAASGLVRTEDFYNGTAATEDADSGSPLEKMDFTAGLADAKNITFDIDYGAVTVVVDSGAAEPTLFCTNLRQDWFTFTNTGDNTSPVRVSYKVPANYNLITCTAERVGRQSFFGQGAGRFPTASNVVQDCLTILSGDKSFYTGKADTAQLDGSAEAHPYYVRTAAPDDFLRSVTADHWGAGVVTSAVNTYAMLAWARRQLAADPACFIAGIR